MLKVSTSLRTDLEFFFRDEKWFDKECVQSYDSVSLKNVVKEYCMFKTWTSTLTGNGLWLL